MHGRRAIVLVAFAIALVLGARDAVAQVPGKEYAKKLFEDGVDLEKKNDFAGALAKYYEAEQITVTAGLRFHEAYCLEMTNKLTAASDAYESAIKVARDQGKADVEKTAQGRLDALKPRIPSIAVRLPHPPPDADVKLDGTTLAPLLLEGKPFRVDPGDHTITASAHGFAPFTKTVHADEHGSPVVDVVLEKTGGPPRKTDPQAPGETHYDEAPPAASTPKSRVVPIAATAAAVVFVGGGVVSFLVAGGAQSDAQTKCPGQKSCDSEQSKVRLFDALALGGFIAGAGFAAIAIVTWSTSGGTAMGPRTRVVASPARIGLEGTF